jgi:hypothetical protein
MRGRGNIVMHEQFYAGSQGCIVTEDRAALNVAIADIERLRRMAGGNIYLRAFDPENLPPELAGQEWARATRPLAIPSSLTAAIEAEQDRLEDAPEGRRARQRIELTVPPPLPEPRLAQLPAPPVGLGGAVVRVGYTPLLDPVSLAPPAPGAGPRASGAATQAPAAEEAPPAPPPTTVAGAPSLTPPA